MRYNGNKERWAIDHLNDFFKIYISRRGVEMGNSDVQNI